MKEKIKKYWQKHGFIFVVVALFIAIFIILFFNLSPGRALTTNIYPDACSGEWFGADRVLGQANTLPESGVESFNSENSAFYRGGDATIICDGFKAGFDGKKEKFISARLVLALAVDEFKPEIPEQVVPPSEEIPAGDEEISNEESQESSGSSDTTESAEIENQNQQPDLENQEETPAAPAEEPAVNQENQSQPENLNQEINFLPRIKEKITFYLNSIFNFINHYQTFPALAQEGLVNNNANSEDASLVLPTEATLIQIPEQSEQTMEGDLTPSFPPSETQDNNFENNNLVPSAEPIIVNLPEEQTEQIEPTIENDLTPVFLPIEIKTEESVTSTTAQESLPLDAILNLRYLLEQKTYLLNTFSSYPISPATNNGYFYFDLPEVKSFDDLEKAKISIEGLLGGYPDLVAYLDSLWIEVTYEKEVEAPKVDVVDQFDANDWEIFVEKDKRIYQITDNNFDDKFPNVYQNEVVWQSQIDGRWQIFWLDFDTFLSNATSTDAIIQISDSNANNISPQVYNKRVVWQSWLNGNWEIMVATKSEDGTWTTERITNDQNHDMSPFFSEGTIFWEKKTEQGLKSFKASKIENNWQIEELVNQIEK